MGKGRTGIAQPTELLPHLMEQTGVEPMTDNPMSSISHSVPRMALWVVLACRPTPAMARALDDNFMHVWSHDVSWLRVTVVGNRDRRLDTDG
jgi:hypothetical protein